MRVPCGPGGVRDAPPHIPPSGAALFHLMSQDADQIRRALSERLSGPAESIPHERRSKLLMVKVTPRERVLIRHRANAAGLTVAAYLRALALDDGFRRAQTPYAGILSRSLPHEAP